MKILLSINPEYVKKIFSGEKKYEYRRNIFKNKEIESIIIYCTYPIKKIVGEFLIEKIIKDSPNKLWELSSTKTGITKEKFDSYFLGKEEGYAIKIGKVIEYSKMKELKDYNIEKAPQSFQYI
ncbi:hypothetical protein KST17_01905 [Fusobacterium canifelinum]|uniref:hypothetical protein n=1 Tax=Fusobacterium canifelinum TaxID=285729 RepID=UPI0030D24D49